MSQFLLSRKSLISRRRIAASYLHSLAIMFGADKKPYSGNNESRDEPNRKTDKKKQKFAKKSQPKMDHQEGKKKERSGIAGLANLKAQGLL